MQAATPMIIFIGNPNHVWVTTRKPRKPKKKHKKKKYQPRKMLAMNSSRERSIKEAHIGDLRIFWKGLRGTVEEKIERLKTYTKHWTKTATSPMSRRKAFDATRAFDDLRSRPCTVCNDHGQHRHHIVPLSMGGFNVFENLITLCLRCHRQIEPWIADPQRDQEIAEMDAHLASICKG